MAYHFPMKPSIDTKNKKKEIYLNFFYAESLEEYTKVMENDQKELEQEKIFQIELISRKDQSKRIIVVSLVILKQIV